MVVVSVAVVHNVFLSPAYLLGLEDVRVITKVILLTDREARCVVNWVFNFAWTVHAKQEDMQVIRTLNTVVDVDSIILRGVLIVHEAAVENWMVVGVHVQNFFVRRTIRD